MRAKTCIWGVGAVGLTLSFLLGACGPANSDIPDANRADVGLSAFDAGSADSAAANDANPTPDSSALDLLPGQDLWIHDAGLTDQEQSDQAITDSHVDDGTVADSAMLDAAPTADVAWTPDVAPTPDATPALDAASADVDLPSGPTRYLGTGLRSPLTPFVVARLRQVRSRDLSLADDVFMKVGASGTVNSNFMACFAGTPQSIDLDGRGEIQPSIDHFAAGNASGADPFTRISLAAEVGRTAAWSIAGTPSPVDQEQTALAPRFALVNYGTNDMNMGTTHRTAMYGYYTAMWPLLDTMLLDGVVPVVTGLNPRADTVEAARWAPTYNLIARGLAQHFQIPFIDLFEAVNGLANHGLIGDGIHGTVYSPSGAAPCDFTTAGLAYNYNMRNVLTMQTLHDLKRTVVDGLSATDSGPAALQGQGSAAQPWILDGISFTHTADTRDIQTSAIDGYPSCDSGQDESGGEYFYRLDLATPAALRMIVLDLGGVDIDLHLLEGSPLAASCTGRADKIIERTLAAGTYYLVLDTFVPPASTPRSGSYMLVVLACQAGDPDCL